MTHPRKKARRAERLRAIRLRMGLTMRDVERESAAIAFRFANPRYLVRRSQLSLYERGVSTPSVFKLYSLRIVYRCAYVTLLGAFGVGRARLRP